jgi:hypothetical protein
LEYTQSATECAFLLKTDSEGDIAWTQTFQIGSYGNCVQQTEDGGYILVGMIVSNDQPDIYLVKTDSYGDTLWTKIIGSTDSLEFAKAVRQLADGYIAVGHIGPMPVAGVDGLLLKTDPTGEVLWQNTYGDSLSDVVNSVEIAPDGGFFVVGNTNCMWHVHSGNMWAFRTDPDGNLIWERSYDIAMNDYAWSCTATSDSCYVVSGFLGYMIGGDLWLAKIGPETGIEEITKHPVHHPRIRNHPNPFSRSTIISYSISKPGFVSMKVYDALGRQIQVLVSRFHNEGVYSISFDATTFPSGVYFCKLYVGNSIVESHRLLLVR